MNEQLTSLEVVSVKPCYSGDGCYIVGLQTNLYSYPMTYHVDADNPYHAVNRKIKRMCEDYGTTRYNLNGGYGVKVASDYDAGWKYLGGNNYRFDEPVVEEPVKEEPMQAKSTKSKLYLTNLNGVNGNYHAFWVLVSPEGNVDICPGNPQTGGLILFENTEEKALDQFMRMHRYTYDVVDVRDANFFLQAENIKQSVKESVVEEPVKEETVNTGHTFSVGGRKVFVVHSIEARDNPIDNFTVTINEYHPTRQHLNQKYPMYALNADDAFNRFRQTFGPKSRYNGIIVDARQDKVDLYADIEPVKAPVVKVEIVTTVDGEVTSRSVLA
jgi:hypothetical protein